MKIDVNLVNPFFSAFYERVKELVPENVSFQLGEFHIREEPYTSLDINVLCSITGEFNGKTVMSMDTRVALEIAEIMFGRPVDSFESDAQSAVTELMNIIIGNSITRLGKSMEGLRFTPTKLVYGRPVNTTIGPSSFTFCRAIQTGWGIIEFNLSLDTKE